MPGTSWSGWFDELIRNPRQSAGRLARLVRDGYALRVYFGRRFRENNILALSAALCFQTIFALVPVLVLAFLVAKSLGVLEDSKRSLRAFLDASGFATIAAIPDEALVSPPAQPAPGADARAGSEGDERDATPAEPRVRLAPDAPPAAVEVSPDEAGEPTTVAGGATTQPEPRELTVINLADRIEEVVTSVESKLTFTRIGPIGAVLLIWSALGLLLTVERSLNRIFGAPDTRNWVSRMLLYWSSLTLGPVAIATATFLGRRLIATVADWPFMSSFLVGVGWLGPIVVGVLALTLLYALMPNTPVPLRAAALGALVASVLWLVAKWAFGVYVAQLVLKGNLYGMLGVLPLFFIWLNISWMIFLLGAEIAHLAADPSRASLVTRASPIQVGPSDLLAALLLVARRFEAGDGPVPAAKLRRDLELSPEAAQVTLDLLERSGLLHRTTRDGDACFLLARSPATIRVAHIVQLGDPRTSELLAAGGDGLEGAVSRVARAMQAPLSELTLADVLRERGAPR